MGTIRKKMLDLLDANCISGPDAEQVLQRYLASELGASMAGRMDEDEANYKAPVIAQTWMGVQVACLEWMDAECPRHWARPIFEESVKREQP